MVIASTRVHVVGYFNVAAPAVAFEELDTVRWHEFK